MEHSVMQRWRRQPHRNPELPDGRQLMSSFIRLIIRAGSHFHLESHLFSRCTQHSGDERAMECTLSSV